MSETMTLAELADASGLPARTIRFYIARGLVDGPVKAGRGAAYTAEHLVRLERIKKLQADGRMLSEIAHSVDDVERHSASAVSPTAWWQHAIGDDVVVLARADVSPWRTKQVRAAIEEMARRLEISGNGKDRTVAQDAAESALEHRKLGPAASRSDTS